LDPARFIHSGMLEKKKGLLSAWYKRFFVLIPQHLAYFEDPSDVASVLPKGVIHVDGITIETEQNSHHFTLALNGEKTQLFADSPAEKERWISLIRENDPSFQHLTSNTRHIIEQNNVKSQTFLCRECKTHHVEEGMFDLDSFTLGYLDGKLHMHGDEKAPPSWAVFAKGHLGVFASVEDIPLYRPLKVYHVREGSAKIVEGKDSSFTFQAAGSWTTAQAESATSAAEWVATLNSTTS